jgi:hypothetical protein
VIDDDQLDDDFDHIQPERRHDEPRLTYRERHHYEPSLALRRSVLMPAPVIFDHVQFEDQFDDDSIIAQAGLD